MWFDVETMTKTRSDEAEKIPTAIIDEGQEKQQQHT
nr:MAG TPA: hypothetical protein [Caudoviricetes sp.]